jgi:hypothetical protein
MPEKALELATHITHPATVAAFTVVVAFVAFGLALHAKKTRVAWVLAITILMLGVAPLVAWTYLQSRGIYRIRIVVLALDNLPFSDVEVTSSVGGEIKKANDTWELDIPPQTRPADGRVTVSASARNAFLAGSTSIVLGENYYLAYPIHLQPLPAVVVRGVVLDAYSRPVSGARVAVEGFQEVAVTNELGNFEIPAHAARQQMLTLIAKKGELTARQPFPAGDGAQLVLRRH